MLVLSVLQNVIIDAILSPFLVLALSSLAILALTPAPWLSLPPCQLPFFLLFSFIYDTARELTPTRASNQFWYISEVMWSTAVAPLMHNNTK